MIAQDAPTGPKLTPESAARIRERANEFFRMGRQLEQVRSLDDPIVQEIIESLRREVAALQKLLDER